MIALHLGPETGASRTEVVGDDSPASIGEPYFTVVASQLELHSAGAMM